MSEGFVDIRCGDALTLLRDLPAGSVDCVVTSPPYFGLRDYGHPGQLGLEKTPEAYIAKMVEVFGAVRRALKLYGTVWLNLGDSYGGASKLKSEGRPKDLLGIPWRVALALQAEGWYLRQDIIWHKPNAMPESVRDRCTKAHEYVFLLSKHSKYYFDQSAIQEAAHSTDSTMRDRDETSLNNTPGRRRMGGLTHNGYTTRNRRSVWTVPTAQSKAAHFAVFPERLVEPMILAGCPEGGTVLDPFGGSGTVAAVAARHGRNAIHLDVNPEYCAMARERVSETLWGAAAVE